MGFFSKEEQQKLKPAQFWNDGVARNVTVEKEWVVKNGKDMVKLIVRDVDTQDENKGIDFALQDALRAYDGDVKEGETVFQITPRKVGEREWNSNIYDIFEYSLVDSGRKVEPAAKVEDVEF